MTLMTFQSHDALYFSERPTARKPHVCQECHGQIAVGVRYHRDAYIYNGSAQTHIYCPACGALINRLFAALSKNRIYGYQSYKIGHLYKAIIELRDKNGITIEGFEYPPAGTAPELENQSQEVT